MVAKHELQWMSILTCDTNWMHEFVMLLVDPLVKRESLVFAMQHSVCHVESKVFTSDQDKHVSDHFPRVWKTCNIHSPWDLPVVHICSEGKADTVQEDVIKNTLKQASFDEFPPANWIDLPWPWVILLNFELFKEWVLTTVYDPENGIQGQNHGCSKEDDVADEKLRVGQLVSFWEPHAVGRFLLCSSLHGQCLNDSVLDIRIEAIHDLGPYILCLSRPVPEDEDGLGPSYTIPKSILAEKVVNLDTQDSLNVKIGLSLLLSNCFLLSTFILHW